MISRDLKNELMNIRNNLISSRCFYINNKNEYNSIQINVLPLVLDNLKETSLMHLFQSNCNMSVYQIYSYQQQ